jgi:hypothetical protein
MVGAASVYEIDVPLVEPPSVEKSAMVVAPAGIVPLHAVTLSVGGHVIVGKAFTVTVIVAFIEHAAAGVNVYVVDPADAVLIVAGLHVPVIPLFEVVGRASGVVPTQ